MRLSNGYFSPASQARLYHRAGSFFAGITERQLRDLEFRNIEYAHGDGYQGWRARAPFDAIMITAAPRAIPEILIEQLSLGGKMVLPVGDEKNQHLQVLTRTEEAMKLSP